MKISSFLAAFICLLTSCSGKSSALQTVIDPTLQTIITKHVSYEANKLNSEWGFGIMMDIQSNTICANYSTDTTHNYAFAPMEMGTLMQPFAILAALSTNKISLDTTISISHQGYQCCDRKIFDSHPLDTLLTIRDIIALSSNVGTCQLIEDAFKNDPLQMTKVYRDWGICPFESQKEPTSISPLLDYALGYHYTITPVKVISLYSVLVHHELNCSTSAQQLVCQGLHDVVWNNELGTAAINPWGIRKAQSDIVSIAGKTGSAQIYKDGKYLNKHHRISFVGYFPEDNPRYICLIIFNDPKFPYDAGTNCGGCVRKIAEERYSGKTIKRTNHAPI